MASEVSSSLLVQVRSRPECDSAIVILARPESAPEHLLKGFGAIVAHLNAVAMRPLLQRALLTEGSREARPEDRRHHERHVAIAMGGDSRHLVQCVQNHCRAG